jgi:hypothetical protein
MWTSFLAFLRPQKVLYDRAQMVWTSFMFDVTKKTEKATTAEKNLTLEVSAIKPFMVVIVAIL